MTQFGYFGDHAPADDDGFLKRARSLAAPDIADFLEIAEPVTGFHTFVTKQCRMLRFEKLQSFPERLLVIGDAVCSLNPIYGQGLTKAAREAGHLWDSLSAHLEQGDSLDGFSDKSLDARKRLFDTLMLVNPPEHLFKPGMIRHALGF